MKKIKLPTIKITKQQACKAAMVCSFMAFLGSLTTQVILTNKYAVKGSEMSQLISRREELETDLSLLKIRISEVSSMKKVEERAHSLGFVEYSQSIAVIDSSQFAAIR